MSFRDNPLGELKVPLTWTAAVAVLVALVVAIALLATDRRGTIKAEAYGVTRNAADAVAAPVGGLLSTPIGWARAGVDAVRGYFFAISENQRLKRELGEARQWRDRALALQNVNERYRVLLDLKTEPPIPMISARVVSDARGPFANTRLANVGKEKGVQPGYPVMSENGLVGRVIGVTTGASRILLLTDVTSRTPVMIDRTNARAILTGDGGPNPRLDYLRGQEPVRSGDRVVTSGDGGLLPRGLPVGVAAKGLDGRWRVVLASDRAPIDFVRILQFRDFSQLADQRELSKMPVPPPSADAPTTVGVRPTPPTPAPPAATPRPSPPAPAPAAPRAEAAAPASGAAAAPRPKPPVRPSPAPAGQAGATSPSTGPRPRPPAAAQPAPAPAAKRPPAQPAPPATRDRAPAAPAPPASLEPPL